MYTYCNMHMWAGIYNYLSIHSYEWVVCYAPTYLVSTTMTITTDNVMMVILMTMPVVVFESSSILPPIFHIHVHITYASGGHEV